MNYPRWLVVIIKSIKTKLSSKLKFDLFIDAFNRASINKRNKKEVLEYLINLESNIIKLMNDIYSSNYHLGEYKTFYIYEPKERVIRCLPFEDRIVHQWYVEEFLKPYYSKSFVYDTYACIEGKGTHKAIKRLQKFMKSVSNDYYIIKFDIKKYFENIDKDILFNILKKKIKDKYLVDFTYKMIYENNDFKGICIGNYTSQWFANIYLNELDHYVKEVLRIKCYLRYMDDFIVLVESKDKAKDIYNKVNIYINSKLHLELNKKSRYYSIKYGCDFCGYIIYKDYIKIRKRNKKKINKSIKVWNYLYKNNRFNYYKFISSYNSYISYLKYANTCNYIRVINNKIIYFKDK